MDNYLYLRFELANDETDETTKIEKEFGIYGESEFGTVVEQIRQCLVACGYGQKLVDEYIPAPLD